MRKIRNRPTEWTDHKLVRYREAWQRTLAQRPPQPPTDALVTTPTRRARRLRHDWKLWLVCMAIAGVVAGLAVRHVELAHAVADLQAKFHGLIR